MTTYDTTTTAMLESIVNSSTLQVYRTQLFDRRGRQRVSVSWGEQVTHQGIDVPHYYYYCCTTIIVRDVHCEPPDDGDLLASYFTVGCGL